MSIFSRLRSLVPTRAGLALAISGGVLLVLSFPDFGLGLTWAALAALFFAINFNRESLAQAFVAGWLFGTVFFTGSCWWLTFAPITYAQIPAPLAYMMLLVATSAAGIFPGIFGAMFAFALRHRRGAAIFAAPFLWISSEALRMALTGNNWNAVGYAHAFGRLAELAEFGGVYLVGFVPAAVAALIFWIVTAGFDRFAEHRRAPVAVVILFVVFGWLILLNKSIRGVVAGIDKGGGVSPRVALLYCLMFVFGGIPVGIARVALAPPEAVPPAGPPTARIVAIQPNVPMDGLSLSEYEALLRRHVEMTEKALRENVGEDRSLPVVVIFPESPMMFQYGGDAELQEFMRGFVTRNRISLLFNSAEMRADTRQLMNSAVMIGADGGRLGQYDKIHLVPFGEFVPFPEPLASMMPAFVGTFRPGDEYDLLPVGDARAGVMICFESHFGSLSREYTRLGADLLIEMTNDGYLGKTPVLRQHLASSVFRAVETGRPLVRATNVGVTALIDPRGRILDEADVYTEAVRVWNISLSDRKQTFYVKWGEWFAWLAAIVTVLVLGASFKAARRNAEGA